MQSIFVSQAFLQKALKKAYKGVKLVKINVHQMKDIEQKAVKYNFQLYLQLSPPCDLNRKEEN